MCEVRNKSVDYLWHNLETDGLLRYGRKSMSRRTPCYSETEKVFIIDWVLFASVIWLPGHILLNIFKLHMECNQIQLCLHFVHSNFPDYFNLFYPIQPSTFYHLILLSCHASHFLIQQCISSCSLQMYLSSFLTHLLSHDSFLALCPNWLFFQLLTDNFLQFVPTLSTFRFQLLSKRSGL